MSLLYLLGCFAAGAFIGIAGAITIDTITGGRKQNPRLEGRGSCRTGGTVGGAGLPFTACPEERMTEVERKPRY